MLRIGLTGGIGSGKTTVAKIFEVLGVPVYYADQAAKRLMLGDDIRRKITSVFGDLSYNDKGLNKKYIASVVFNDPGKLALLNSIVHPATISDAAAWLDQQTSSYAVKEAALIFESGAQKDLDYIIGVSSPLALRIERIKKRDGISDTDVIARINRQLDETIKLKLCDFIIVNDEKELLVQQVVELHGKLSKLVVSSDTGFML
jgi:dephospho-CoA kinase